MMTLSLKGLMSHSTGHFGDEQPEQLSISKPADGITCGVRANTVRIFVTQSQKLQNTAVPSLVMILLAYRMSQWCYWQRVGLVIKSSQV